jgi:hypothetical protein
MTLTRRERFFACVVALVVGALLLSWLVVEPGTARWSQAHKDLENLTTDIEHAERVIAREKAVQAKWEALKAQMKRVSLDEVLYFVDHLWELASKAGTSFQKAEPQKRVDAHGDFNEISFDFRLLCSVQSLSKFAYELDTSPELLKVRRLQVTSRPGAPTLDVDVQISTLEPAAAPAAPPKKAASHDENSK